ncbi:MAG: DegV family protein [Anaerolineaceae bacterium]
MNPKVAIVTDSTAHIPEVLLRNLPVFTIPLHLIWGGISYRDDVDITPAEFYSRLKVDRETPKTSHVTPFEFHKFYEDILEKGYDILSIHITSKYTKVYDSAVQASQMFPDAKIQVLDSGSGAMAMGFQVLEAAKVAKRGESIEACRKAAEKAQANTRVFFIPATLEFLRRGGRISHMTALIGSILQFKPILTIQNGSLVLCSKVRTMHHAIDHLVEIVNNQIQAGKSIRFAFLHSNFPERAQELLEKTVAKFVPDRIKDIIVTDISPTLGTHIGPDAVGLAYMMDEASSAGS